MELAQENWYTSWFDTPYYHILYKNRGKEEAESFMQNLVNFLQLPKGATILDLACGKGRHSLFLNRLGYHVTGIDLSDNSITYARQFENEKLQFRTHCMSEPVAEKFDAVFNLFTSLGYFENEEENISSFCAIKQQIKPGGFGVIDFMNAKKVVQNLIPSEVKRVKGIDFRIRRSIKNGYILKDIEFQDQGEDFEYTEKVKTLTLEDFLQYFKIAGLDLLYTFGNYDLEAYDEAFSDRLILVFK